MNQTPQSAGKATAEQLAELADAVHNAAAALNEVFEVWVGKHDLPGDLYTPESSYPFELSLDEQVAALWSWHDAIVEDAQIAAGKA